MMRVCVVGATGVIGRSLVPLLLDRGHQVLALARSLERPSPLSEAGAGVERFDPLAVGEAGRLSEPLSGCSAVVHAATAAPRDFAAPGAWDANTRLRTEGTRLMLEAALSAGVAQAARKPEVPGFALAGGPRAPARGGRGDLHDSNRSTVTRTRRAQKDDNLDPDASPEGSPVERGDSCRRQRKTVAQGGEKLAARDPTAARH